MNVSLLRKPGFKICFSLSLFLIFIGFTLLLNFSKEKKIYAKQEIHQKIPHYYQDMGRTPDGLRLFFFENIIGSSGKNETLYRAYDGNKFYKANKEGSYESDSLSLESISLEKPQPSISKVSNKYNNHSLVNAVGPNVTIKYDLAGQYLFNYAASANIYGRSSENAMGGFIFDGKSNLEIPLLDEEYGSYKPSNLSDGTLNMSTLEMDRTIKGNASKSELRPSKNTDGNDLEKTNIKAAYLVMEASVDLYDTPTENPNSPNKEALIELQNVANRPMTLVGPTGEQMLSNGYLPRNFTVDYDRSHELTSTKHLSSNIPTIIYSLGGIRQRLRASTITDVTDFIKKSGYGEYYGYHIPVKGRVGNFADVASGWKIIIIEEDKTMPYSRVGALELGMINSNENVIGKNNIEFSVNLGGYKTPESEDFDGQLFFSSVGSNPQSDQYLVKIDPDPAGPDSSFVIETKDQSDGNINRGISGAFPGFGQNIISIDGQRRKDMSSYRTTPKGIYGSQWSLEDYLNQTTNFELYTDGMDVELLHINNKRGDLTNNNVYHNAYVANGAVGINLDVTPSRTGDNFITALGILTEVELPVFKSEISHTDINTNVSGESIAASDKIEIKATAENDTKVTSNVKALTNTQVEIELDQSLSVDWSSLMLDFKDFDKSGNSTSYTINEFTLASNINELNTSLESNTYFIDKDNNNIFINFGTDEIAYASENDKNSGKEQIKKLYNNLRDRLDVRVIAQTSNEENNSIIHTINVTGGDAINENELIIPINSKNYSKNNDLFATYNSDVILHLRQIILNPHEELVIPTKTYGLINDSLTRKKHSLMGPSAANQQVNFDTYLIRHENTGSLLTYEPLIPQYYKLVGYVLTPENKTHSEKEIVSSVKIDTNTQKEVWLSIYVTPSTKNIKPYSWSYNKNDLGIVDRE